LKVNYIRLSKPVLIYFLIFKLKAIRLQQNRVLKAPKMLCGLKYDTGQFETDQHSILSSD